MTRFRPCIDLHAGQVKQIVGGTLTDDPNPSPSPSTTSTSAPANDVAATTLKTNHVSAHPAGYFATLYRQNACRGAHVIMLGPGNEEAAREALSEWPGGLQVGGGVAEGNACEWIERGAEKVIVTSYLFPDAKFSQARLDAVLAALGGDRSKLVIDLSCRRRKVQETDSQQASDEPVWVVAMNKWTRLTDMEVNAETITSLEPYCSEFLIHAADVEGLQAGMDEDLIRRLADWCSIPCTYAGGGRTVTDLERVERLSGGRVDLTIGSALDIFGGRGVRFEECVAWNERVEKEGKGGIGGKLGE